MDRLMIITGLSGSGKSLAARCFEDLGYFCVDNLPVLLITQFYDLIQRSQSQISTAALVVDIREKQFLVQLPAMLRELREQGAPLELLFFECSDNALKRRFSETRRPHPMSGGETTLEAAIRKERAALQPLRDQADRIIDTTQFNAHELRAFLQDRFGGPGGEGLRVNVLSFGFKYGLPAEADLIFDVRFLPNPYFVEELRPLNGTSEEVRSFLERYPEKNEFFERLSSFLDYLLPLYRKEGKSYLSVAFGCTGGKHRSVALAEQMVEYLKGQGVPSSVSHRDMRIE